MKRLLLSLFFILIWQASGSCLAQTPQEGYITTPDGVRLFYKIVGNGSDTVVAVHGGPGNSLNSILPDLEPLAKNRRVIYYDQRGNGRSDLIKEPERLAISKHIADLETVRQHFKLDKVTLLGNSWGGLLVSAYAAAHPDKVQRMILHSPAPPTKAFLIEDAEEIQARVEQRFDAEQKKRWRVGSNTQTWVKAADPRAVCREFMQLILSLYVSKPESMSRFRGDVCSGSEEAVRSQQVVNMHIWRSLGEFNLLPSLGVIKAPVLVIHGAADPIPFEASEAWAAAMPNARLLLLKDSGHIPQIEQPEMFFKAIETFLKGEALPEAKKVQGTTEKK